MTAPGDLSPIARVIVLSTVELFRDLPHEVLADLAAIATEVRLQAGEPLFRVGDVGAAAFVVVEGGLAVHLDDHVLNRRGARTLVGEYALLDTGPRSASVTAYEDTLLLAIDKEAFDELLGDRPEVGRALAVTLARELRARGEEIAELDRRLAAPGEPPPAHR